MAFIIKYGTASKNIDITQIVFKKCMYNNNLLVIPEGDLLRDNLFTDPIEGIRKCIFVFQNGSITEYDDNQKVFIYMSFNVDTNSIPEPIKQYYCSKEYTAIIIEPRPHNALFFVLDNFLENLSNNWTIILFHGNKNTHFISTMIDSKLLQYKHRIRLINLKIDNLTGHEYSSILKNKDIYDHIETDHFLVFQTDTLILKENKHIINDFLQYDYVGAPWKMDHNVGNGGLSLRRKSKMLEIIDENNKHPIFEIYGNKFHASEIHEDVFFSYCKNVHTYKPDFETAKQFSVETILYLNSFGIHKPWQYLAPDEWEQFRDKYPEVQTLKDLQTSLIM